MPAPKFTAALTKEYNDLFNSCEVNAGHASELEGIIFRIMAFQDRYEAVADTFVAPEQTAGGYRGYALLRVSRSAARFTAKSIFVQTSVPYDKSFLDKVQKDSKN